MALTATKLQDAIILIENGSFGDFEKRSDQYGALQAYIQNASGLLSQTQVTNLKKAINRTEKVPVLNRYSPTVITDPTCSVTGGRPASAFASLTWAFKGFEIEVIPEENEANYITEEEDIAWQMASGLREVFENMDTAAIASLESNKNTSLVTSNLKNVATNAGDYTYSGEAIELFLNVPALMRINQINGNYEDVANTEAMATMARLDAFGAQNYYDLNGAVHRQQSFRHYMSNRLTVPDGSREAHYIFPERSVGIFNWVDYSSRQGYTAGNKSWGTIKDPMFGFDWQIYKIEDCVDNETPSGNKRAYGYKASIGAWFCFLTQYHSSTESQIVKVLRNDPA